MIASDVDRNGMNILHQAAVLDRTNIVEYLAEKFGQDLASTKNNFGQTALHFCAAKGINLLFTSVIVHDVIYPHFFFLYRKSSLCCSFNKSGEEFCKHKRWPRYWFSLRPPPPKSLPRSPQNSLTPRPTFWEYFLCFVQVPRLCFTPVSAASFNAFSAWQTSSSQTSGSAPTQEFLHSWSPHKVVTRRLSSTCSAILKPVTSDSRAMMGQLCFTWQLVRLNITSTCLFNQCWSNRYCSFFS